MIEELYAEHMRIMNELPVWRSVRDMAALIREIKENDGRLFFIGNGGGAGHASHAAADFRKIGKIESYAWGENVSDLTAYVNDTTWGNATKQWLADSNIKLGDGLFVFSVGGTDTITSHNLLTAVEYAHRWDAYIMGITGMPGRLIEFSDCQIVMNTDNTPIVEGIQSVLWHMIVNEI